MSFTAISNRVSPEPDLSETSQFPWNVVTSPRRWQYKCHSPLPTSFNAWINYSSCFLFLFFFLGGGCLIPGWCSSALSQESRVPVSCFWSSLHCSRLVMGQTKSTFKLGLCCSENAIISFHQNQDSIPQIIHFGKTTIFWTCHQVTRFLPLFCKEIPKDHVFLKWVLFKQKICTFVFERERARRWGRGAEGERERS